VLVAVGVPEKEASAVVESVAPEERAEAADA
jgi:hypothetical protein